MISQLTLFLSRKSSSTQKKHLKSAKILVNRNEKSNLFLGMTSRTCCNLIGCWGMANLFSSNLGCAIVENIKMAGLQSLSVRDILADFRTGRNKCYLSS